MTFGRYEPLTREQKLRARSARMGAMARGVHGRAAVMAGGVSGVAVVKDLPHRDAALLDMAKDRPCLFLIPAVCNHRIDTTVAAHENQNKGMARKASDERSAWACFACHAWFDQGTAPRDQKRAAFEDAHGRQVLAWQQVAVDAREPERFRRAARRALEAMACVNL